MPMRDNVIITYARLGASKVLLGNSRVSPLTMTSLIFDDGEGEGGRGRMGWFLWTFVCRVDALVPCNVLVVVLNVCVRFVKDFEYFQCFLCVVLVVWLMQIIIHTQVEYICIEDKIF